MTDVWSLEAGTRDHVKQFLGENRENRANLCLNGLLKYRGLHKINVCNRNVKSEKATAFLIRVVPLFSDRYLTTISHHCSDPLLQMFCTTAADDNV